VKYLMVALGFANGVPCPHAGQYLLSFDHEHDDGLGWGEFTKNRAKAKRFDTREELFEFWTRVPKCRPLRPDGQPNRPMTALSVTTEPVDE
jgi:hypothetical protein